MTESNHMKGTKYIIDIAIAAICIIAIIGILYTLYYVGMYTYFEEPTEKTRIMNCAKAIVEDKVMDSLNKAKAKILQNAPFKMVLPSGERIYSAETEFLLNRLDSAIQLRINQIQTYYDIPNEKIKQ